MKDKKNELVFSEIYKSHIILNKLIPIATKLNFLKIEASDTSIKKIIFWKDELNRIEFIDDIKHPSVHIDSSIIDIVDFKTEMDSVFSEYSYSIENHHQSFYFDLTKQ